MHKSENINEIKNINKPVRVLHAVSKMDMEGIQNFIMNVYRNIDRSKIQFDFLVHAHEEGAFDKEIEMLGGKLYKLNKLSGKNFFKYSSDLKKVFRSQPEYRIIHSHLNLLNSFVLKEAAKANIPVRISHSHTNSLLNTGIKKLIKLYAKSESNKYCTHAFACSKEAGIWQFGQKAWDGGKVTVIPNGIDTEKFKFNEAVRRTIRSRLGITAGDFVIGHSGGFRAVKNHKFLLEVFARVIKEAPNAKLLLTGDGGLRKEIETSAAEKGLTESVFFTGSVPNVCGFLQAMDCFAFPSLYEGLGMSLVEAQAAGLQCFASDTIPQEAVLSERCVLLPLSEKLWAEKLLVCALNGTDTTERSFPKAAGKFEIGNTAGFLEQFYLRAI